MCTHDFDHSSSEDPYRIIHTQLTRTPIMFTHPSSRPTPLAAPSLISKDKEKTNSLYQLLEKVIYILSSSMSQDHSRSP